MRRSHFHLWRWEWWVNEDDDTGTLKSHLQLASTNSTSLNGSPRRVITIVANPRHVCFASLPCRGGGGLIKRNDKKKKKLIARAEIARNQTRSSNKSTCLALIRLRSRERRSRMKFFPAPPLLRSRLCFPKARHDALRVPASYFRVISFSL